MLINMNSDLNIKFRNYRLYGTNLFSSKILIRKALITNIYEILKIS